MKLLLISATKGMPVFIVWSGLGFLVIPVVIVGAVVGGAIIEAMPNDRWLALVAVVGTAVATLGLGLLLNRKQVVGRDARGNAVTQNPGHSLYWIPVQYWSAIILVIGAIVVFKR